MMIGKVKIGSLKRKPKEPSYRNAFARRDCSCADCAGLIRHDAWFINYDNPGISKQRLADAVAKQNGWIEDGPYRVFEDEDGPYRVFEDEV